MLKAEVTSDSRVMLFISGDTGTPTAVILQPSDASEFAYAIERAAKDADRQRRFIDRIQPQAVCPELAVSLEAQGKEE